MDSFIYCSSIGLNKPRDIDLEFVLCLVPCPEIFDPFLIATLHCILYPISKFFFLLWLSTWICQNCLLYVFNRFVAFYWTRMSKTIKFLEKNTFLILLFWFGFLYWWLFSVLFSLSFFLFFWLLLFWSGLSFLFFFLLLNIISIQVTFRVYTMVLFLKSITKRGGSDIERLSIEDDVIQIQSRSMSDPPFHDIDFKNILYFT